MRRAQVVFDEVVQRLVVEIGALRLCGPFAGAVDTVKVQCNILSAKSI